MGPDELSKEHRGRDVGSASHDPSTFRFGGFELDPLSGRLTHDGEPVRLRLQSATVLALLCSKAGQVVSRDEIRDRLWGVETHVDHEQGINTCVREIRVALEDEATDPRFVQTVAGEGYRLIVPVEEVEAPAGRRQVGDGRSVGGPGSLRGRAGRTALALSLATAVAVLAVAGLAVLLGNGRGEWSDPGERSTVRVLFAGLENRTGDPLLDDSLSTALRIGFDQLWGVVQVPDAEVREALLRMKLEPAATLDRSQYGELAQRLNADHLIVGHTARLGSEYLVALEVVDPVTDETLHAARRTAAGKDRLLSVLDRLLDDVSGELLDRSVPAGAASRLPLAQVTTANLEALKAYSIAQKESDAGRYADALPLFGRAVELDPELAMAHARMGVILRNAMDLDRAREHFRLAKQSAERLTPYEALYVDGWLATIEPDPERSVAAWSSMARLFPQNPIGHYNLGAARKVFFRDYRGCAKSMTRVLALSPKRSMAGVSRLTRAACRQAVGQRAAAIEDLHALLADPEAHPWAVASATFQLAALGLHEEAEHLLDTRAARRRPDTGEVATSLDLLDQQARTLLALEQGSPADARRLLRGAVDRAERNGLAEWELASRINLLALLEPLGVAPAEQEVLVEETWRRSEELLGAEDLSPRGFRLLGEAVLGALLARRGRVAQARELRERFVALRAEMTVPHLWQGYLDVLDAELALRDGRPRDASALLERTAAEPPGLVYRGYETLARSYLEAGDDAAAERTFRWLLDHRDLAPVDTFGGDLDLDLGANLAAYRRARAAVALSEPSRQPWPARW